MSILIPGNQKYLTQEDRVFIETSLDKNMPFCEIAKYLCKDPSTISKEVRKHRLLKEHTDFVSHNQCALRASCRLKNVCRRPVPCKKECRTCTAWNKHCVRFEKDAATPSFGLPMSVTAAIKKRSAGKNVTFIKPSLPTGITAAS